MDTSGKMSSYLHRNILDLIEHQAERRPDAIAFEDTGDLALSYGDVAAKVRNLGASLTANGVQRDSRVAIVLPNGVEMALALLGVSVTAIAAPLNPAYRREEFRSYFEAIRVGFLVVCKDSDTVAGEVAAEMGIKVLELSGGGELAQTGPADCADAAAIFGAEFTRPEPDDIAAILMTSGSTGRQKLGDRRRYC